MLGQEKQLVRSCQQYPKTSRSFSCSYALVWNTSSRLWGSKSLCGSQPHLCVPLPLCHLWRAFSGAFPSSKPGARGGVPAWLQLELSWLPLRPAPSHPRLGTMGHPVLGRKLKNTWKETTNDASYLEILSCMTRSTLNSHWGRMGAQHLSDKTEVVVHWLEKWGIHWICTIYQLIPQQTIINMVRKHRDGLRAQRWGFGEILKKLMSVLWYTRKKIIPSGCFKRRFSFIYTVSYGKWHLVSRKYKE